MLSARSKLYLYIRLLLYRKKNKAFHKRKLAVGFIRFRYTYYIYDNTVMAKYFEPALRRARVGHVEQPVQMIVKRRGYTFKAKYLVVLLIVLASVMLLPLNINYIISMLVVDGKKGKALALFFACLGF